MTTWYTYCIELPKGSISSSMSKIEDILHQQNWTYEHFLYKARQVLTGKEADYDKANTDLLNYYHSLGISDDYLSIHRTNLPFLVFCNYDQPTGEPLRNDLAFDQKIRKLLENPTFLRHIGGATVIYQGINWRGPQAEIPHNRHFPDSIILYGGKYVTLYITVDDLSDTSDRIAAIFTEAFGKNYRVKHMQSYLTAEEQAMPINFPALDINFCTHGLYHPPSEDRSKTGKSIRLTISLERAGAVGRYTIHTGNHHNGGAFLKRRNEHNHVLTIYLGCNRTGEIGVDGETLYQSATCNAVYEGVNFTRTLFMMNSRLTTQRALDEFVVYSLNSIDWMYNEIQKYHITDIETPPWFTGFYSCY